MVIFLLAILNYVAYFLLRLNNGLHRRTVIEIFQFQVY